MKGINCIVSDNDRNNIELAKKGDLAAYENLITKYESEIFSTVLRIMGNLQEAEDITQETFLRAYTSLKEFADKYNFRAWIYKIALNLTKTKLRLDTRRQQLLPTDSLNQPISTEEENISQIQNNYESSPEVTFEKKETQEYVQKMISFLPKDQRMMIVLRELQGFSYQEIAELIPCSIGTVKSRIARARETLCNQLKKYLAVGG